MAGAKRGPDAKPQNLQTRNLGVLVSNEKADHLELFWKRGNTGRVKRGLKTEVFEELIGELIKGLAQGNDTISIERIHYMLGLR